MIRPIHKKDIAEVVALMHRNLDMVLSQHHSPAVMEKFKSRITAKKLDDQMRTQEIVVAEVAGEIVATGTLSRFGNENISRHGVSNVFVTVDLHGRGIGKSMLDYLLATAREKGIGRLYVQSARNAIPFFKRVGFVEDEDLPESTDELIWLTIEL